MDTSVALEEIQSRIHTRAFSAVMDPTKGPAVKQLVNELLSTLGTTSPDGVL